MAKICGKYVLHCNGIDPFVTLMGNFNWGPISRNDIVSKLNVNKDKNDENLHQNFFITI